MNEGIKQIEAVLGYMLDGNSITSKDAFEKLGATRLSSIIFKLKKKGFKIATDYYTVSNRFGNVTRVASYRLEK